MVGWLVAVLFFVAVVFGGGIWAKNSFIIADELPNGTLGINQQVEQLPPEFFYARDNAATIRWQYVQKDGIWIFPKLFNFVDRFEAELPDGTKVWVEAGDGNTEVRKRVIGRIVSVDETAGRSLFSQMAGVPLAHTYVFGMEKGNIVQTWGHKELAPGDREKYVIAEDVYAPEIKALFRSISFREKPEMWNHWVRYN